VDPTTYTQWSLQCHKYRDLPLQLLPVVLDREVDVRIYSQGMVMCRLIGTVPAVSDMHSGRRAVNVGSLPADRRRGYVAALRCSLRVHCSSARLSSPAADHNYPLLTRAAL
jgi:hypothetical protein